MNDQLPQSVLTQTDHDMIIELRTEMRALKDAVVAQNTSVAADMTTMKLAIEEHRKALENIAVWRANLVGKISAWAGVAAFFASILGGLVIFLITRAVSR